MIRKTVLRVCGVGGVLAILAVIAVLSGFVPLPGSASTARPPCADLPTRVEVAAAINANPSVTQGLESAAPGVRVGLLRPCSGEFGERAMVRINVSSDPGRRAVEEWLNTHDGYGVPIEIQVS